jgi:hypothetical protein
MWRIHHVSGLWRIVADCGRLWPVVADCGGLWRIVAERSQKVYEKSS